jgi:hypothetical protein
MNSIDQVGDNPNPCTKYKVYLIVMIAIAVMVQAILTVFTVKYFRTFGFRKKLQVLFLCMLNGATFVRIAFFGVEYASRRGNCRSAPSE